jgi:RND family efflux transporter MFP subunit
MKSVLTYAFAFLVFGGVGGLLTLTYLEMHPEKVASHEKKEGGGEAKGEKAEPEKKEEHAAAPTSGPATQAAEKGGEKEEKKEPPDVRTLENGQVAVRMDEETQQRLALSTRKLKSVKRHPEIVAYGVLQEDPDRSFVVRSPFPGYLKAGESAWPQLGQQMKSGTRVGSVAPRLTPSERADLAQRLAAAQAEVDEVQATLKASRAALERQQKLSKQELTSDKSLQEAQAAVSGNEAKLEGAMRSVKALESVMTATTGPAGEIPLTVEKDGQVVQAAIQPGEVVESGQNILQLANYDQLLVRLEVPVGQPVDPRVSAARVLVAGHEDEPIRAAKVGPMPSADNRFGGQSFLYRLEKTETALQPGMVVTALLELPGDAITGVLIPRSAVVRYAGRAWVYVRSEDEEFVKQEVVIDHPEPGSLFVTKGLESGDSIVVQGAQSLLAKELTFSASEGGD